VYGRMRRRLTTTHQGFSIENVHVCVMSTSDNLLADDYCGSPRVTVLATPMWHGQLSFYFDYFIQIHFDSGDGQYRGRR
jgi:hypothetical protein